LHQQFMQFQQQQQQQQPHEQGADRPCSTVPSCGLSLLEGIHKLRAPSCGLVFLTGECTRL
jgi:hypothetical protein